MSDKYIGKTAVTFGVFDLLHYGHFELFRRIKELVGENGRVIVLLQRDEWVSRFKNVKLVYDFEKRKQMIEALKFVSQVIPYDVVGIDAVRNLRFDLLVRGPEHISERFLELSKWCEETGKEWTILPRTDGISTTLLKSIIKDI